MNLITCLNHRTCSLRSNKKSSTSENEDRLGWEIHNIGSLIGLLIEQRDLSYPYTMSMCHENGTDLKFEVFNFHLI